MRVASYSHQFVLLSCLLGLGACVGSAIPVVEKNAAGIDRKSVPASGVHRVRTGDTLYSIAFAYSRDLRQLAKTNGIPAPYLIRPGDTISLRPALKRPTKNSSTNAVALSRKASTVQAKKPKRARKPLAKDSSKSFASNSKAWVWPASGKVVANYGRGSNKGSLNKGIDIAGKQGQSVLSTRAGKVVYSGSGIRGYGNLLIVQHNEEFLSAYAHNRRLLVSEGELVKEGQKIAEMGSTGAAREAKLHFEIRRSGKPVNPMSLLPKRG